MQVLRHIMIRFYIILCKKIKNNFKDFQKNGKSISFNILVCCVYLPWYDTFFIKIYGKCENTNLYNFSEHVSAISLPSIKEYFIQNFVLL